MRRAMLRACAPLLLALTGMTGTASAEWQVTTIADSRGALAEFSLPVINAGGQVAFTATSDNVAAGAAVYRLTGATLLTIADTTGPLQGFLGDPSINTAGEVAFAASLDAGGDAVLTGDGTTLTTIASTVADNLLSVGDTPFINDPGTVVFKAAQAAGDAILTGGGGPLTTVVDESGPYDSLGDTPSISNDGTIAFYAGVDAGGFGVFTTKDGATVATAASSSDYTSLANLGINNNNEVLMRGVNGAVGTSLFQESAGTSTSFVDSTGIFDQLFDGWVGDSGTVAFKATLDLGLNAIFSGGVLSYERAVAVGDALNGSTITQLQVGRQAINSSGKFVFWARLADDTEGVYLAVPKSSGGGGGGSSAVDALSLGLLAVIAVVRRRRT